MIDLIRLILTRRMALKWMARRAAKKACERCAKPPDLVLLDLMMPDMDGWEVYQQIKADEKTRSIPVIVVTAKAQSIDKVLGLQIAKVDDYIAKPFSPWTKLSPRAGGQPIFLPSRPVIYSKSTRNGGKTITLGTKWNSRMFKRFFTILTFIVVFSSFSIPAAAQSADGPVYIVQSGDTLSLISSRFNVDLNELMNANSITNPNLLSAGQELVIPGLEGVSGVLVTEFVQFGDSFRSLSRRTQIDQPVLRNSTAWSARPSCMWA
jgi:two-component system, OmpR family, response regulator VicR